MDVAVSSYTPTLEVLLRPAPYSDLISGPPDVLVVSQPDTPGHSRIPGTEQEAASILSIFPQYTDVLHGAQGSIAAVLQGMKTHEWVHLACHGLQSDSDPTQSAFSLHDGKLTLSKLMSQALPHAELAFLSACQTASGDQELPEEAVHLAAGMLNVGYKSVIGTMWSIGDRHATMVAGKFYEVMKDQITAGGKLQPAYALHEATQHLRKNIGVNELLNWIPFVHFGL
jgi:CHAT domain-containing protein